MDNVWIQQRPHLAALVLRLEPVLERADELYIQVDSRGRVIECEPPETTR